jgi:hypothetical protein
MGCRGSSVRITSPRPQSSCYDGPSWAVSYFPLGFLREVRRTRPRIPRNQPLRSAFRPLGGRHESNRGRGDAAIRAPSKTLAAWKLPLPRVRRLRAAPPTDAKNSETGNRVDERPNLRKPHVVAVTVQKHGTHPAGTQPSTHSKRASARGASKPVLRYVSRGLGARGRAPANPQA